jgi:hypothetical protein
MVSAAHADTVYSNMTGFGCACGPLIDESQSLAGAFTPNANYSLTGAQAQLEGVDLGTPDIVVVHSFAALDSDEVVDFALYSDAGGVPGVSLATLGSASFSNSDEGVYSVNDLSNPVELLAGTQYWLVLTPGTAATTVIWEESGWSLHPQAATSDSTGMSGWLPPSMSTAAFEIDGTPVTASAPEPATVWLLIGGVGAFGLRRVRPFHSKFGRR